MTLEVSAPEGMPLETMLRTLQQQVEPALYERLPEDGAIVYSGSAEKLGTALSSLSQSFLLAVVILYLLMSALFRSFLDSLLVLLALPLAAVLAELVKHVYSVEIVEELAESAAPER